LDGGFSRSRIPAASAEAHKYLLHGLANIVAGSIVTLVNGFLTFIPPLFGWGRPPALPEYLFFATIETLCTVYIVWLAWTWPGVETASSSEPAVGR